MNKVTLSVGVLAGTVAVAIYLNKELLWEVAECFVYDKEKVKAIQKLRKIRLVLNNFIKELELVEKLSSSDGVLDAKTKKHICGLSVDLDYIFDSLDAIQGDIAIKSERKKLVDDFKEYGNRVDRLAALIRRNQDIHNPTVFI